VITESVAPEKRSKVELEQLVKANGGKIFQSENAEKGVICIGDRRTVKVAALQKRGIHNIVRPKWIFDCINQSLADTGLSEFRVPFEPRHMFFASEENPIDTAENVDQYTDSFSRNTTLVELKEILGNMKLKPGKKKGGRDLREMLLSGNQDFGSWPGLMFDGKTFYFDGLQQKASNGNASGVDNTLLSSLQTTMALRTARFASATISVDLKNKNITHVVVDASSDVRSIRETLKWYTPLVTSSITPDGVG
jgi:DNA ligase-4